MADLLNPVLSIIVVGFHHKKGCQVEYCYPMLVPGKPNELPPEWRYLPALAMPDGSHNYMSDTIFFHLPGLNQPLHTVYAISCFRQIPIEQVVQKTSDMTRSSVQKSVCVVSSVPIFNRLAVKMQLVVREWFLQGDFSQTNLLEEAFRNLNNCPLQIEQCLEGFSVTNFVEIWKHKVLILFKLLLLRRKVVLYGAPAGPLSVTLLTLISLLPEGLQKSLKHSANFLSLRPMSPSISNKESKEEMAYEAVEAIKEYANGDSVDNLSPKESKFSVDEKDKISRQSFDDASLDNVAKENETLSRDKCNSIGESYKSLKIVTESQSNNSLVRDISVDGLFNMVGQVNNEECGLPLELFREGNLCLPYLSLQYLDLLSDPAVEGFVVGASNVLFKQKKSLYDVLVDTTEFKIEIADPNLKRQLVLYTEDLRFADHVLKYGPSQGDSWIREQFTSYLMYILRVSLVTEGSREVDAYNACFINAFKSTPAYSTWLEATDHGLIDIFRNIDPMHPFAGQLSVADMKLKIAHTMSTTEGGRKVTAAVASTGRAVATTSKAVGGALSQAKGALSGWWSSLTTQVPDTGARPDDQKPDIQPSDAEDALDLDNSQPTQTNDLSSVIKAKHDGSSNTSECTNNTSNPADSVKKTNNTNSGVGIATDKDIDSCSEVCEIGKIQVV